MTVATGWKVRREFLLVRRPDESGQTVKQAVIRAEALAPAVKKAVG